MAVHDDLRSVCALTRSIVDHVPDDAAPRSPRRSENETLRRTPGGGGRKRVEVLDHLNMDAQLMLANLSLIIEGVADCFEIAGTRDNRLNMPALCFALRPGVEVAGQIAWLLDHSIDPNERARRFLRWRFADLRERRLLLKDFGPSDELAEAQAELDGMESELLDQVTSAGWTARQTAIKANGDIESAALLDDDGKAQGMPKITEVVRGVVPSPLVYGLLSIPAHGSRVGVTHGMEIASERPDSRGRYEIDFTGFAAVEPSLAVNLALLALDHSGGRLARWNGIDASRLHERVVAIRPRT